MGKVGRWVTVNRTRFLWTPVLTSHDGDQGGRHERKKGGSRRRPAERTGRPAEGVELPERWSAQRKTELVLRLLRGEPLDAVSRESQVPAPRTGELEARVPGDRHPGAEDAREPEERELTLARAKIGELMMRLELAEHLIEKRGLADEWKRSRR